MDLNGKVVLVTGASSGIGAEVAVRMAAKGAKTVLLARREEKLKEVAARIVALGKTTLAVPTDVTQRAAVEMAVDQCLQHFGRLDIVVNSAGVGYFGPIENMTMNSFERIMQTNVNSILHTTQVCLPFLKNAKGMIVNISSVLGKRAMPYLTALSGTKSMVDSFSDGLRLELRRYGIKVLNYSPPETDSEFFTSTIRDPSLSRKENGRKKAHSEDVASRIIRAIEKEKREVVEGKFLKIMNFFAPRILDSLFYKVIVHSKQ